jgi:hypothetical protein
MQAYARRFPAHARAYAREADGPVGRVIALAAVALGPGSRVIGIDQTRTRAVMADIGPGETEAELMRVAHPRPLDLVWPSW